MLYAMEGAREVDTFAIYTYLDTWAGDIHPAAALQRHRAELASPLTVW
jgi:hypothetical protein